MSTLEIFLKTALVAFCLLFMPCLEVLESLFPDHYPVIINVIFKYLYRTQ